MERNSSSNVVVNMNFNIEYYQRHPYEFLEDYFGIKLRWYQKIYIKLIAKRGDKQG